MRDCEPVIAEIQAAREASELCWEQATATATNSDARKAFASYGEACDELYEQAIEQLRGEADYGESPESLLEQARCLEQDGGDDCHARKALEVLESFLG